jgi:hypothetical protein
VLLEVVGEVGRRDAVGSGELGESGVDVDQGVLLLG